MLVVDAPWHVVARAHQVPSKVPYAVCVGETQLILIRTSVGLRCFQGLCPHQGAAFGDGELHGDVLLCSKHRWRFDSSGRRLDGPECLRRYPVVERDGDVLVQLVAMAEQGPAADGESSAS
jgi:phenylpropionate dioxygenase-like ring-hydroxylating dioxygenase large terminal subunit